MNIGFFELLTPVTYWLLIAMWSFILYFYARRLRVDWRRGNLMLLLFTILTIDAFRTLFESLYFGAWYTARVGLLPMGIHDFLVQPQMVIIPKLLNVFAAGLIITILFRYWLPREGEEISNLETTVRRRTLELSETVEKLESEVRRRKRMEEALTAREQEFRTLAENLPDNIARYDGAGRLLYMNPSLTAFLGRPPEELLGKTPMEAYPGGELTAYQEKLDLVLRSGGEAFLDVEQPDTGEGPVYHNIRFVAERDDSGAVTGALAMCRDLSPWRRAMDELQKREAYIRRLIDASPLAKVVAIGPELKAVLVNRKFTELFGYTIEEMPDVAHWWPLAYPDPEYRQEIMARWEAEVGKAIAAKGEIPPMEAIVTCKDGTRRHIEFRLSSIGDQHLVTFVDLTERKQAESEMRLLRRAIDQSGEPLFVQDASLRFIFVNQAACRSLGYSREELQVMTTTDIDPDITREAVEHAFRTAELGKLNRFESRHRAKDGRFFPVEITGVFFEDHGQRHVITRACDISERKRVEDILRFVADPGGADGQSGFLASLAHRLGKTLGVEYVIIDRLTEEPGMAETIALYAKGEIVPNLRYALAGTPCDNVFGKRACSYPRNVQALFPGDALLAEMGVDSYAGTPLWDSTGRPIGLIAVMGTAPFTDEAAVVQTLQLVTPRAAAELERVESNARLRTSEQEFRTLAENSPDNIARYDTACRMVYCNPCLLTTLGVTAEEVVGKTPIEGKPGRGFDTYQEKIAQVLRSGEEASLDLTLPDTGEGERFHNIRFVVERNQNGVITGVLAIGRDITERKQMEEALTAREQEFRTLAENSPDLIIRYDRDLRRTYVNPVFERITGVVSGEVVSKSVAEKPARIADPAVAADYEATLGRVLDTGLNAEMDYSWLDTNGGKMQFNMRIVAEFDESGAPCGVLVVARDISERLRLEEQLAQARKMEAIGVLAGGIAHDFNNILTPILMRAEMALMGVVAGSELDHDLHQIIQASERARNLVSQILDYSRQGQHEPVTTRLGPIVKEGVKFLRATTPANIELTVRIATDDDAVLADPTQMLQVLMNLVVNAVHAMEGNNGVVTVSLDDAEPEPGQLQNDGKEWLRLEVRDSGRGIAPELLDRIFEPYFTTKVKGEGTGMGLAVVHGIVANHHGTIRVHSELGKGTIFTVLLPKCRTSSCLSSVVADLPLEGRGERILLVDDEPAILDTARTILEQFGYKVTAFTDSTEALAAFTASPEAFDLILTDQTMPKMTGKILAAEMLRIRPNLPVVLCTGFSEEIDQEKAGEMGIAAFLFKPLSINQLAGTVRRALDEATDKQEH